MILGKLAKEIDESIIDYVGIERLPDREEHRDVPIGITWGQERCQYRGHD